MHRALPWRLGSISRQRPQGQRRRLGAGHVAHLQVLRHRQRARGYKAGRQPRFVQQTAKSRGWHHDGQLRMPGARLDLLPLRGDVHRQSFKAGRHGGSPHSSRRTARGISDRRRWWIGMPRRPDARASVRTESHHLSGWDWSGAGSAGGGGSGRAWRRSISAREGIRQLAGCRFAITSVEHSKNEIWDETFKQYAIRPEPSRQRQVCARPRVGRCPRRIPHHYCPAIGYRHDRCRRSHQCRQHARCWVRCRD
jgi:hypothetical protein